MPLQCQEFRITMFICYLLHNVLMIWEGGGKMSLERGKERERERVVISENQPHQADIHLLYCP